MLLGGLSAPFSCFFIPLSSSFGVPGIPASFPANLLVIVSSHHSSVPTPPSSIPFHPIPRIDCPIFLSLSIYPRFDPSVPFSYQFRLQSHSPVSQASIFNIQPNILRSSSHCKVNCEQSTNNQ